MTVFRFEQNNSVRRKNPDLDFMYMCVFVFSSTILGSSILAEEN